MSLPPIPAPFIAKKEKILTALATPSRYYVDLSPKGSVDAGIRDLIDRINALDGVVTTSSCAGRISVFLEGSKASDTHNGTGAQSDGEDRAHEGAMQAAVPGGKGRGGRWLFVSHDPIDMPAKMEREPWPISSLFGLSQPPRASYDSNTSHLRFARFQFEPMILHIMTASLHHAQPILSAALTAGFRESGVQTLKNLDDPHAFPMVAIRTSGLALESVVGYLRENEGDPHPAIHSLVEEHYLAVLVRLANERFDANAGRVRRFSENMFIRPEQGLALAWEDKGARRGRLRAEGLERQRQRQRERRGVCGETESQERLDGIVILEDGRMNSEASGFEIEHYEVFP